jgi:hypothetical protein
MSRRALVSCVFLLLLVRAPAWAHVGSPTVFFDGAAGPWPVRVIVRPPAVIPGLALVTVRVKQGTPRRVTVQPEQWQAGRKGAPPADEARPVPGDRGAWSGQLWIMTPGSYSVRVEVAGDAGTGVALVPLAAVRQQTLAMRRSLGVVLALLGLLLTAGAASLAGAALRESVLPPGEEPDAARRRRARLVTAATAAALALLLFGGKHWWDGVEAEARERLFRPFHTVAEVKQSGAARLLRLAIDDPRWQELASKALLADHGKLMHLFLIREPGMDAFAHLHPVPLDADRFEAPLPEIPAGRYRLYADIVLASGFAQTLTAAVAVPPSSARDAAALSAAHGPDPDDSWRFAAAVSGLPVAGPPVSPLAGGEVMEWQRGRESLTAGREIDLRFRVHDAAGQPAALEPYMGMQAHAVITRDDGRVFVHLHPVGSFSMAAQMAFEAKDGPGGAGMGMAGLESGRQVTPGAVSFPYEFPQPGRYRLWVQVKTGGAVRTGVFDADVAAH